MEPHFSLWLEARTRFSNLLPGLTPTDLTKKLPGTANSVGFLLRHIADVELLFARNVFGKADIEVSARTVIDKRDTGEWIHLEALLEYLHFAFDSLAAAIKNQTDWETPVVTKEFGTKTRSEALGRIVSHTAYYAGQMALALKYA